MGEISDAQLMTTLRQAMDLATARQIVSASNLANVNTPGYKAREAVAFDDALQGALSVALRTTNARHLQPTPLEPEAREVSGLAARRDGNTVQIDRELLEMTRAGGAFARAQTALAAKFRLVRYAINESR
jgi:flagellar basal-body rod protein FlgB